MQAFSSVPEDTVTGNEAALLEAPQKGAGEPGQGGPGLRLLACGRGAPAVV